MRAAQSRPVPLDSACSSRSAQRELRCTPSARRHCGSPGARPASPSQPDLPVLSSSALLVPVLAIFIGRVCQERPYIHMALGYPILQLPAVMHHRDQPIPVVPDVEDDVPVHRIRIRKCGAQLRKIPPTHLGNNRKPRCNLRRGFFISRCRMHEVLPGDSDHKPNLTLQFVMCKDGSTRTASTIPAPSSAPNLIFCPSPSLIPQRLARAAPPISLTTRWTSS